MTHNLPSRHQIYDMVNVHLGSQILRGQIKAAHFTDEKVTYDLDITGGSDAQSIFGIDSAFISGDLAKEKESELLTEITAMANQSLSPEVLEMWEKVKEQLQTNRHI